MKDQQSVFNNSAVCLSFENYNNNSLEIDTHSTPICVALSVFAEAELQCILFLKKKKDESTSFHSTVSETRLPALQMWSLYLAALSNHLQLMKQGSDRLK